MIHPGRCICTWLWSVGRKLRGHYHKQMSKAYVMLFIYINGSKYFGEKLCESDEGSKWTSEELSFSFL